MKMLAQAIDPQRLVTEVSTWNASQTINVLFVGVLLLLAVGAYYGARALFRSIDQAITMLAERFTKQDSYQREMDIRHNADKERTHETLGKIASALESVSDSVGRMQK